MQNNTFEKVITAQIKAVKKYWQFRIASIFYHDARHSYWKRTQIKTRHCSLLAASLSISTIKHKRLLEQSCRLAHLSIGRSVRWVNWGKTADRIWMPFGVVSGIGRGMSVLDRGGDCQIWRGHCNQWEFCGVVTLCREGWRRSSSQITLRFLVINTVNVIRAQLCNGAVGQNPSDDNRWRCYSLQLFVVDSDTDVIHHYQQLKATAWEIHLRKKTVDISSYLGVRKRWLNTIYRRELRQTDRRAQGWF